MLPLVLWKQTRLKFRFLFSFFFFFLRWGGGEGGGVVYYWVRHELGLRCNKITTTIIILTHWCLAKMKKSHANGVLFIYLFIYFYFYFLFFIFFCSSVHQKLNIQERFYIIGETVEFPLMKIQEHGTFSFFFFFCISISKTHIYTFFFYILLKWSKLCHVRKNK